MRTEHVTYAWVSAFVAELRRAGIRHACACPGSRSTPLAMALASRSDIRLWMHLDERSAGFFALGLARALGEPVALVCTSGTAAANFLPAVVEAALGRIPLLVLTADRPPQLRDVGAPQTIDQVRLYGDYVKWAVDVPLPESMPEALRYAGMLAARAAATTRAQPAGPVHLNLPFREPLVPSAEPAPAVAAEPVTTNGTDGQRIFVEDGAAALDEAVIDGFADALAREERGLIVCGPRDGLDLRDGVTALARALGYPILADPLSGVRAGPHDRALVLDAYDAFLRDDRLAEEMAPHVVLRFGAMPTSKPVTQFLERHRGARHLLIDGGRGWRDPSLLATDVLHANPRRFCASLVAALRSRGTSGRAVSSPWADRWLRVDRVARQAITRYLDETSEPFEGKVFSELADLLPDGAVLFAGNSMPVRDLDTFFPASARRIEILANRGANGIDGVVSTALGVSATGANPLVLVIGDISFYHDLNGLLAAKLHRLNATIILLNNNGGGIFSFLPQAAHPEHFEMLFGTPHGLDFRPAVEMYGGRFERVATWRELRAAISRSLGGVGLSVVELSTSRDRNVALHRALWSLVSAAVADQVPRTSAHEQQLREAVR